MTRTSAIRKSDEPQAVQDGHTSKIMESPHIPLKAKFFRTCILGYKEVKGASMPAPHMAELEKVIDGIFTKAAIGDKEKFLSAYNRKRLFPTITRAIDNAGNSHIRHALAGGTRKLLEFGVR